MASISAAGVGSNLDINGIISQLMSVERAPLDQLTKTEKSEQTKLSAFGQIRSTLSALKDAATTLQGASSAFQKLTVTSSDSTTATATASGTAPGEISVQVNRLAQQQKLASSAFASASTSVGTGRLTLEFGSVGSGSFVANPDKAAVNIDIPAGSDSLADVRDAINDANAGVRASIITDASGSRLTISSIDGGGTNTLRITATDDDGDNLDASGLSSLAFDPDATAGSGRNLEQKAEGIDAEVVIDGIMVYSPTNQLKGVVDGVDLTVAKTTTAGNPVSIKLERTATDARAAVESFIKAYNDFNTKSRELTAYNAETRVAGTLQGDSTVRTIGNALKSVVGSDVSTGGSLSRLSDIGITLQRDGSLKMDAAKFDKAFSTDPTQVEKLFSGSTTAAPPGGFAVQLKSTIEGMLDTEGALSNRTDSMNANLRTLSKRKDDVNTRLELVEARLRRQFTALDTNIGRLNATSSYLSQQLASLPGTSS